MDITVIIPNYNGMLFLKACLDALKGQNFKEFETLIIDNGSTDGSVEFIEAFYPEMRLVKREENYGFCNAVNEGIRLAKTPYVLLLNNDTEVEPDFVEELLKAIREDNRIFSVSSKMLNFYNRSVMDDAGDMYSVIGWQFQRGVGRPETAYQTAREIFSSCAGAAIYRKTVFEKIGFFDESHFAYLEDMDIGYRAKIYGYKNRFCPTARIYHVGSGTSGSKYNDFKVKLSARNSVYLVYKNMPVLQLILNLPALAAGYFLKWLFFVKKGFGATYRKGVAEGIRTCKRCKKVNFNRKNLGNYIFIQLELIANFFLYAWEFFLRKVGK